MSAEIARCKNCASDHTENFNAEIALHFPGPEGLDKPIVWVFPRIWVCLGCGFTGFSIPEGELTVLRQGIPIGGAMISTTQKAAI